MGDSDIGIAGLGVMGRNIALNFSGRGSSVAVWNPGAPGEDDLLAHFLKEHGCDSIAGARLPGDFTALLHKPRVIMVMVKAGSPVDDVISRLAPHLEAGDIVIDGGNSHYLDTARRAASLERQGILYVGCGVSGGGEGALRGPSLMLGGSPGAREAILPLLRSIAAKPDNGAPCCEWMGPGGSGHFVKMVHNAIEYAMMQAIAEAYDMMKRVLAMTAEGIAGVFSEWNRGSLGGYLVGIVPLILARKEDGGYLLDSILDRASQKGTGRDASAAALVLGVPVPAVDEAVSARIISSLTDERRSASELYRADGRFSGDRDSLVKDLEHALYCAIAVSHAQGFALLEKASAEYGWGLDRGTIARVWRGGCIIQSGMMKDIENLFGKNPAARNLLAEEPFVQAINEKQSGWRRAVSAAALCGIPAAVLSSALAYFDSYRSARLPTNLVQAMRDFFGAHGYERIDAQEGKIFRTDWTE